MSDNASAVSFGMLAATQAVATFTTLAPSLSEVRKASVKHDPGLAGDVRMAEMAAAALTLGVGAIGSSLSGSSVPIVMGAVMTAVLIGVYEMALQGNRPGESRVALQPTYVTVDSGY